MANKNAQKLLIAAIIGIGTGFVSLHSYTTMQHQLKEQAKLIKVMELGAKLNAEQKFKYLTPVRDMEAGETVTKEDIKLTGFSTETADGIKEEGMIVGNVLLEPIKSGQVFTGFMFTRVDASLRENPLEMRDGYRSLTLATSALDGLSSQIKEGMLIDVFSKEKDSQLVLSKVKILALEPLDDLDKKALKDLTITKAKSATFEVPINKLQDFVNIYASGKMLLVMRPVNDTSVIKPEMFTSTKPKSAAQTTTEPPMTSMPALPKIQTYQDPTIEELPAPIRLGDKTKTVEIIEAATKSHITFE